MSTDTDYEEFVEEQRIYLEWQCGQWEKKLQGVHPDIKLVTIDGGYRIKETASHFIDVMQMTYNWRITTTPKDFPGVYDRGWCYQGQGLAGFLPAALAALAWDGSDDTEPPGYFKRVGD